MPSALLTMPDASARCTEHRITLSLPPGEALDLHATFRCGQIFRWHAHGDSWYGAYRSGSLRVRQVESGVEVDARGVSVSSAELRRFLALDHPLREIYRALGHDPWVRAAMDRVPGLRILRQDPWECVAGYICSQWNNIPKIELSMERIARAWGTVHRWPEGVEVATFPPAEVLAALAPEELKSCALGYRCRYLVQAARMAAAGAIDLAAIRTLPYDEALREVLRLPGVGRKVADCILLFSMDQPTGCPVDVWVRRVVHELYPRELEHYLPGAAARAGKGLSGREYDAIVRFARDRWGEYAGYAQQYLFHARRAGLLEP